MASSNFPLDDQSDADFFDNLINDETDTVIRETNRCLEHLDSHNAITEHIETNSNTLIGSLSKLALKDDKETKIKDGNTYQNPENKSFEADSTIGNNAGCSSFISEDNLVGASHDDIISNNQQSDNNGGVPSSRNESQIVDHNSRAELSQGYKKSDDTEEEDRPESNSKVKLTYDHNKSDVTEGKDKPENTEAGSFSFQVDDIINGTNSSMEQCKPDNAELSTEIRQVDWSGFQSSNQDTGDFASCSEFLTALSSTDQGIAHDSGVDFFTTLSSTENQEGQSTQQNSTAILDQSWQVCQSESMVFTSVNSSSVIGSQTCQAEVSANQNYQKHTNFGVRTQEFSSLEQSHYTVEQQPSTTRQWEQSQNFETMPSSSPASGSDLQESMHQSKNAYDSRSIISYSNWQPQGNQSLCGTCVDGVFHHVKSIDTSSSMNIATDQFSQHVNEHSYPMSSTTHSAQVSVKGNDWNQFQHEGSLSNHPNSEQPLQGSIEAKQAPATTYSTDHYSQHSSQTQANIYVDPNYPGWYFDLLKQEWFPTTESFESKNAGGQWQQLENSDTVPPVMPTSDSGLQENIIQGTNTNDSQSIISYSNWPPQGNQSHNGGSVDGLFHHVKSIDACTSMNTATDQFSQLVNEHSYPMNSSTHSAQVSVKRNDWSQFQHSSSQSNHADSEQLLQGSIEAQQPPATTYGTDHYSRHSFQTQENIYVDPNYPGWYFDLLKQEWFPTAESFESKNAGGHETTSPSQTQKYYSNEGERTSENIYSNKFYYNSAHQISGSTTVDNSSYVNNYLYPNSMTTYSPVSASQHDQTFRNLYTPVTYAISSHDGSLSSQHMSPSHSSQPNYQVDQAGNNNVPICNFAKEGRSPSGRPPHALATFAFGGKLAVFNPNSSGHGEGVIRLYNLGQLASENLVNGFEGNDSYFSSLCQHTFSGPLVGGSVGNKEIYKWIDERIANYETKYPTNGNSGLMHLLLCSLKIFCQHYGKIRSAFSAGGHSQESDGPEAALTKLFSTAKPEFDTAIPFLQPIPSEGQLQVTALEMKNFLVAGKRMEALSHAQKGQLWGPALVLALQLGEKFYVETVTQMAKCHFLPGSPLRTLYLLLAGQPAEVFSSNNSTHDTNTDPGMHLSGQECMNGMLNHWQENLAIITANRTNGDERVIMHLGDCLWKERGEVASAHTCYLVAEANFEYFSDSSRLCLLGADHWKFPRTFASPEAIQRTEVYEYGKNLGNPQYVLLPFQPYKLIYAHMLADVGKVSDSLKYCLAVSKLLKNAGRAPEVEMWRQIAYSMEDRLRIHSQGGFGSNLAPGKLMGRFISSIDKSLGRIIGGPPPPATSDVHSHVPHLSVNKLSSGNTFQNPISTSLMPSMSMEPLSEQADYKRASLQTRSISAPEISSDHEEKKGRPVNSKTEASATKNRFGRFGFQFLQKAVGFVSRTPRNQVKLGEENKFYYDPKLKRWVEEGAAAPAEEATLSAPPTSIPFNSNYQTPASKTNPDNNSNVLVPNSGSENKTPVNRASGTPPIPPSANHFSARGRLQGVRSRYVDTFNKGGSKTPSKSFQPPIVPTATSKTLPSSPNFFLPTPAPVESTSTETANVDSRRSEVACTSTFESVPNLPIIQSHGSEGLSASAGSMHRFSSVDDFQLLAAKGSSPIEHRSSSVSLHSRAASWGDLSRNPLMDSEESVVPKASESMNFLLPSGRLQVHASPRNLDSSHAPLPSPPPIEAHSVMSVPHPPISSGNAVQVQTLTDDLQDLEL
eukprot:TRINITY_DN2207_c0_g5_i2.p1 TRINITY_DN2207_c0_g5~~TRINITY_DN2207_c0_g5_i2.p1  ORF type:complete len:1751 (+),score=359.98 TRINITY_DN2207_c0_g5_i2:169-5421(+)